jgi:hypothetical protein
MADFDSIALLEWRPLKRNSLRGFATIRLGKFLKISDIAIHASHGRRWAQLPSKPQVENGVHVKDQNGKPKWVPILSWTERDVGDRFSEALIRGIEAKHPGDTCGDS